MEFRALFRLIRASRGLPSAATLDYRVPNDQLLLRGGASSVSIQTSPHTWQLYTLNYGPAPRSSPHAQ
jgi:hypothetical protein